MPRYIQHPVTGDLIPAHEYVRPYMGPRSELAAPRFITDTVEVKSMLDGKTYTSKAALRASYKAGGVEEVGNDRNWSRPATKEAQPEGVKDDLAQAFAQHS